MPIPDATPRKAPVLADVARRANVSVPTVSRVLSGGSRKVDEDLIQRVRKAAAELGYRPNAAARALVSGRRSLISVLAGGTAHYGFARTFEGIEHAARADGMSVSITVVESAELAAVEHAVNLALGNSAAGVIALEFDQAGRAAVEAVPIDVPMVVARGGSHGGPGGSGEEAGQHDARSYALIDEQAGGRALTEYLLGLGHPTVHHVAVPQKGTPWGRTEGWRAALAAAGAPIPAPIQATWAPASGRTIGREMAEHPEVTAVFCGNDDLAIGVIRGLTERGVRVPEDVSVVGFDDQPFAEMWTPGLTTARQDFNDLGARAYALLAGRIAGRAAEESAATPTPVIRESAGPYRQRVNSSPVPASK